MAATLLGLAVLIFSVGPCLGRDDALLVLNHEREDSASKFDDVSASSFDEDEDQDEMGFSDALMPLEPFHSRLRDCSKIVKNRCIERGGTCLPRGSCPGETCGRCSRGCDCCVSRCNLIKKSGHGSDHILMYYFDSESKQCRTFHYHGQGGNSNRFPTYEECQERCEHIVDVSLVSSAAEPSIDPARCNDDFISWLPQITPLSYTAADLFCTRNGNRLACPIDELAFIDWIQGYGASGQFAKANWFAGTQRGTPNWNILQWASNERIRLITNGTNLWVLAANATDPGFPIYPLIPSCVMAQTHLSNGDCLEPRPFFCITGKGSK